MTEFDELCDAWRYDLDDDLSQQQAMLEALCYKYPAMARYLCSQTFLDDDIPF